MGGRKENQSRRGATLFCQREEREGWLLDNSTPTEGGKNEGRSGLDTSPTMEDGDTNAELQTAQGTIYVYILRDAC